MAAGAGQVGVAGSVAQRGQFVACCCDAESGVLSCVRVRRRRARHLRSVPPRPKLFPNGEKKTLKRLEFNFFDFILELSALTFPE